MAEKPYPSRVADQFVVRFPGGMRDRISDAARAAGRSMNAEIVKAIEAWLGDHEKQSGEQRELTGIPTDSLLAELRRRCR